MSDINPRVDIAFKKIFGTEENKDLLISLINSIVGEADQVSEVTLLNPYNPKNFKTDKLSILDIKATGRDGKRFNVEIQVSDEADYDKRALYYWAKLYSEQLKSTENYSLLCKAIGIHILNFTSIPEVKKYHNIFHITEKENGSVYFKDLELHTIELKKFIDTSNGKSEELDNMMLKVKNSLDLWTAFLIRHDLINTKKLPKGVDATSVEKAIEVLEVMNFTEEERDAYEGRLKWLRIEASSLKKASTEGEARGMKKGIELGIEKGIELGIEKGIEKVAQNMLFKLHLDLDTVQKATGLTKEELQKIIKK